MANDIKILIKAIASGTNQVNALAGSIDTGFKRGKLAMDAFNASTGNGKKIIDNLNVGVKDLVGTYLSLSAAKTMFQGMIDILKKSEQAQFAMTSSVQAANREFQNVGTVQYWEGAIKELSQELVVYSENSLKGAISRTVDMTKRLGLSADQMRTLISRTADLSAGKTDLEGGIERVTSAMRGEAEASEYLGLTLNEDYVKSWYAAHEVHGKVWKDLTDIEKAQVRYQIFLEQTVATQGRAAQSAKTFQGALALVDKAIEDAVTNNQDLAQAMTEVATFIRENADSIGELASDLVTVTAKVAAFALEWKEVMVALGAAWAVAKGVSFLATVINGLTVAMRTLRAAQTANIMLGIAEASTQAMIAGVAFSTWMRGALVLAAGYASYHIIRLVQAYMELKHWEDETRDANKARLEIEDKANKKAQELGKSLGVNVNSLSDFNRLVKEGKIVWDDQVGAWRNGTDELSKQEKAAELTEDQLKSLQNMVEQVGGSYSALSDKTSKYYDFAAEKAKALSSDEQQAALSTLEIYRKKTETLLQIAQDEAERKKAIVQSSGAGEQQQADLSKKIAEDLKAYRIKTLEEWQSKLRSAYLSAVSEERKYADEVKRIKDELQQNDRDFADEIRELQRSTMSEEQQYIDKRKQAYETLSEARNALATAESPEAFKEAVALAKDAQAQFKALGTEVKDGDQVIVSQAEAVKTATEGMKQANDVVTQALQGQQTAAETMQKTWQATMEDMQNGLATVSDQIDELNSTTISPTAEIQVDSSDVDRKLAELDGAVTSSTHYIYEVTVSSNREGGPIRKYAGGGWNRLRGLLPGWGGGDRVQALLEDGEYIIRKEAVRKYGAGLFQALNNMKFNLPNLLSSLMPPMPEVPKAAYATGGSVFAGEDFGTLRLQAGDVELPVQIQGLNGREMVKQFEKALQKERLIRGR
jgi:uncharacterized Zn ribbon protein